MLKVFEYHASNGIELEHALIVVNELTLTETTSTILNVNSDGAYQSQSNSGCSVRFSAQVFKDESVFKGGGTAIEKLMFKNKHYSPEIAYSTPLIEKVEFNSKVALTIEEALTKSYEHIKKVCELKFNNEQD